MYLRMHLLLQFMVRVRETELFLLKLSEAEIAMNFRLTTMEMFLFSNSRINRAL